MTEVYHTPESPNREPETLEEALIIIQQKDEVIARQAAEIAQKDAENERLNHEIHLDTLIPTMFNKRATEMRIEQYAHAAQPFGLFLIDINNFKVVNDTFGHAAGDRLLIRFGELMNEAFRRRTDHFGFTEREDSVHGRVGGDEFVVLAKLEGGARRESDLQKQMYQEYELLRLVEAQLLSEFPEMVALGLGLSMGSALSEGSVDPVVLFAQADEAMYEEKGEKGR